MARRTKKPRVSKASTSRTASSRQPVLRKLSDTFQERRFEPKSSGREVLSVVLMSLGGVALGVGVYAQFLRDESAPPIGWAPYVLATGVIFVVAYFLFGQADARPLRVGELGLGFEQDGKVQRIRWYEVDTVKLVDDVVVLGTKGKPMRVSLSTHAGAARRVVAEAKKRIPRRVELDDDDLRRVGEPGAGEGKSVEAEPPQVTQLRCLASNVPLTFEQDVRMCRRCGALYHKNGVPRRCVECGKKLKS